MEKLQIEIRTIDQAIHLCTMADHFLDDIHSMSIGADIKTLNHLGDLKEMWEQIPERALRVIAELEGREEA